MHKVIYNPSKHQELNDKITIRENILQNIPKYLKNIF